MRTVWLEDCAQEEQRESEEEDAEAAIAEHEKDRSPAAGEENLGVAPYRLYVLLAYWEKRERGLCSLGP